MFHFMYSLARNRRVRYDFVLFNGLASLSSRSRFGTSTWRLARAMGLPTFIYWHETDWVLDRQAEDDPGGARRVAHVAADPATVHLAVSEACRSSLQERFGEVEPIVVYNCTVVPAPFDRPVRPAEPPLVVNLASIQARKGTDLFVETAIKVCRQHPTVEFMWLGGGRPFGTWQREIEHAGLGDRILFPGYVDSGHLILRRASLLFLSSRDDPFPLSVLEAMCLGRTVVTFDVGGAPEALAGQGHLVPAFDTDRAASTILTCLSKAPGELVHPGLHDRYKANYTPVQFARRLDRVLRDRVR
jgi:glycosyltransferase involved in cell wall biosynthesis